MCVVAFDWQPATSTPLRLISNRDEFFERPTKAMHWWTSGQRRILSGRDEHAGGTWLAIGDNARIALVTNFRRGLPQAPRSLSRGDLPLGWLACANPMEWVHDIDADQYAPFNLIGLDLGLGIAIWVHHGSSSSLQIEILANGLHGLSNGVLNEAWPKTEALRQALATGLDLNSESPPDILVSDRVADDALLPGTGLDIARERALSAVFIRPEHQRVAGAPPLYGTRSSATLEVTQRSPSELAWSVAEWQHSPVAIGQSPQRFRFTGPA